MTDSSEGRQLMKGESIDVRQAGLQKIITFDILFSDNDQLKTDTVLQMCDAGIDFKTI